MKRAKEWFYLLFIYFHQALTEQQCEKDFVKTSIFSAGKDINVLLIWFPINVGAESSLRLCSKETGLPVQRHCGYSRSNDTGLWEQIESNVKLINCSSIKNFCLEEPFEHNYIMKNGTAEAFVNRWKTTKMTERGDLQEPCLNNAGLPLTRLCEYNSKIYAAQWERLSPDMANMQCYRNENLITYDLNTLYQETRNASVQHKLQAAEVAKNLTELLVVSKTVRVAADIKISAEILKIITEDDKRPELIKEVLNITNIIMAENKTTITESEMVNASSSYLKTFDNYLQKMSGVMVPTEYCQNITDGIFHEIVNLSSVFYINPFCANITGLAIYKTGTHERQHYDNFTGYYYSFLYMNRTMDYIISTPDLILAAYFPLSLWNNMKNYLGSINNRTVLTFILFQNDNLFVHRNPSALKPMNNILEIQISNYTRQLPEDIQFMYGFPKDDLQYDKMPKCGYWDYNSWSTFNIKTNYQIIEDNQLLICNSTHLTHLGAIFNISSSNEFMPNISHDDILDVITIIGCGLSLFGLLSIWVTAVCFKSFRANPSNKVLLNISFVLTLLMVYFLLANLPYDWNPITYKDDGFICKLTGAFMHYSVNVLCLWMLIIAVMQYLRYVKVIGYVMPSNFILKFSIFAWGLPLIPVSYMVYTNGYVHGKRGGGNNICFPIDNNLKYGVVLPMGTILMINLVVFCCIFCSLRRSLHQFEHHARKYIKNQVRISVLLFFLLGISWIFGVLSFFTKSVVLIHICNLTSALQGFMIFIFFIIFDEPTRLAWVVFCCAKSYNTREGKCQTKYMNMNSLPNT